MSTDASEGSELWDCGGEHTRLCPLRPYLPALLTYLSCSSSPPTREETEKSRAEQGNPASPHVPRHFESFHWEQPHSI